MCENVCLLTRRFVLLHLALKVNRMADGAVTQPVVLAEDPSLFELAPPSAAQRDAMAPRTAAAREAPSGAGSLDRSMIMMIESAQDERIVELLKGSKAADINSILPSTWEAMMHVVLSWTLQKQHVERQAMAFSIVYHVMQNCPNVFARPSINRVVGRLAAVCLDSARAGIEFSEVGGLTYQEVREVADFFKNLQK